MPAAGELLPIAQGQMLPRPWGGLDRQSCSHLTLLRSQTPVGLKSSPGSTFGVRLCFMHHRLTGRKILSLDFSALESRLC